MIESMTARWLLTGVFALAALCAGLVRRSDRPAAAFCVLMCAAMIGMAWWTESSVVTWLQVAAFGAAGLWFVLAGRDSSRRFGRPDQAHLHHALMAAAMVWMLAALAGRTSMAASTRGHAGIAGMSAAALLPFPVLAVTGLVAACCAVASIPWLARALGPGPRLKDRAAAGQAMMAAGMAGMLIAML